MKLLYSAGRQRMGRETVRYVVEQEYGVACGKRYTARQTAGSRREVQPAFGDATPTVAVRQRHALCRKCGATNRRLTISVAKIWRATVSLWPAVHATRQMAS